MGFNQGTNGVTRGGSVRRPATSMGNRAGEEEPVRPSQQPKKGRTISSFPQRSQKVLRSKKIRTIASDQSLGTHVRQTSRDISGLSRRMGNLSLDDDESDSINSAGDQVVSKESEQQPPSPSPFVQPDAETEPFQSWDSRGEETAKSNQLGPAESQATASTARPTTPPHIRGKAALEKIESVFRSIARTPCSPTKQSSPIKLAYLTKDSNLTTFTGWDVDGRLNEFETQFKQMKEVFDSTLTDRKSWEEAMELAKNKGRCSGRGIV